MGTVRCSCNYEVLVDYPGISRTNGTYNEFAGKNIMV